jgi:hypothetical protein
VASNIVYKWVQAGSESVRVGERQNDDIIVSIQKERATVWRLGLGGCGRCAAGSGHLEGTSVPSGLGLVWAVMSGQCATRQLGWGSLTAMTCAVTSGQAWVQVQLEGVAQWECGQVKGSTMAEG